jgi:hypothetical protein
MEQANTQAQPQAIEIDPNIKAIFEDIERKFGQINMLLVLQFTSNTTLQCLAQLPGMDQDKMQLVSAPIVAALNAAIGYAEKARQAQMGKQAGSQAPEPVMNGADIEGDGTVMVTPKPSLN